MNPRSRRIALYTVGTVALLASLDALAHSYAGLYGWAVHHRLSGWQALTWPAEIDVFLVVGELALYVAYLDAWPTRQRVWPWAAAVTGLTVSVAGNVGHMTAVPGQVVTLADRITAAVSPVAAFAGLMIGLLVLKMSRGRSQHLTSHSETGSEATLRLIEGELGGNDLLLDARRIVEDAHAEGRGVSQRALAAGLRALGHRFSNTELRAIANAADVRKDA